MPRPSRGGASYRAVLRLPHARPLLAAATLARLSYGLFSLPLLLSLRAGTGSYALAGTATGLFGLATALLGPARARLVERRPGTLTPMSWWYGGLLAAVAAGCAFGPLRWAAPVLTVLAGFFPPPVGPLTRTRWGLLSRDERQRQAALSLDTVAESTAFALGPVLGGGLAALAGGPAALAVCAAVAVAGFTALSAVLRRSAGLPEPAAAPRPDAASPDGRRGGGPLAVPGFAALLLVPFGAGGALALEEVATVAVRHAAVTGPLLALFSVGGVLGGLAYGRGGWPGSPERRLPVLGALGGGAFAVPLATSALSAVAAAFLLAGACEDTVVITCYLIVEAVIPPGRRTEAGAWVNTAYNLGSALGSGAAGVLVDDCGARSGLVAAAVLLGGVSVAAGVCGAAAARPPGSPDRRSGPLSGGRRIFARRRE